MRGATALLGLALGPALADWATDKARELHALYPVVDGHNDLPLQYRYHQYDMDSLPLDQNLTGVIHTDIERLKQGGVGGQFWSVYIGCSHQDVDAVRAVMEQIDAVRQFTDTYSDAFEMAYTADDVERIFGEGKIASLLGAEGGHTIDSSMGALRQFYQLGVRYMTLTHTCNTPWADSRPGPPVFDGLSDYGVEIVHEMNRLGMLVDIAHTSQDTMRHALRVAKAPLIFSHNCAYALTDFIGAAPDDALEALAVNGGVLMVIFINGCLGASGRPTVQDIANHIDHIRDVAGIDHVGLGADYDGAATSSFPADMEDVAGYPVLTAELVRRGYSDEDVGKVLGGNVIRAMREAEVIARELQATTKPSHSFYSSSGECRISVDNSFFDQQDQDDF